MARGLHQYSSDEGVSLQLGQAGADNVRATTVDQTTNPGVTWIAITMLAGTTISSATSVDTAIWDSLSSCEVPEGTTIYGRWSAITIGTSDAAMCYRG